MSDWFGSVYTYLVEFRSHRAPDLCTLHLGNVPLLCKFHPVRLVELGSDQEIEIGDLIIFT